MNFKNVTKLHKMMASRLGNDLLITLALDEGKYYLAISVHKSNRVEYNHGRMTQSCLIDESEFNTDVRKLVEKIAPLYEEILIEKNHEEA